MQGYGKIPRTSSPFIVLQMRMYRGKDKEIQDGFRLLLFFRNGNLNVMSSVRGCGFVHGRRITIHTAITNTWRAALCVFQHPWPITDQQGVGDPKDTDNEGPQAKSPPRSRRGLISIAKFHSTTRRPLPICFSQRGWTTGGV